MVKSEQVSGWILLVAVMVGAHLADLAVAEAEELGAAVDSLLARPRVAPGHRPLDRDLVLALDSAIDVPLSVGLLDAPARVLADRTRALVRAQPGVVMDGVVGEVRR